MSGGRGRQEQVGGAAFTPTNAYRELTVARYDVLVAPDLLAQHLADIRVGLDLLNAKLTEANRLLLGDDYAPIRAAYQAAVASHRYESVPYGLGGKRRAYALDNEREYFAECTEAYFGKYDFYPFVRAELAQFDPTGYAVVEQAWRVRDGRAVARV